MLTEGQEDGMVGIKEGGAAQPAGRRGRLKDRKAWERALSRPILEAPAWGCGL